MRHNVGIDLDGVICDIYPDAFKLMKELYPEKIKEEININELNHEWKDKYGLTEEEIANTFIELGKRGGFRKANFYSGAKETIYKINKRYNIYFVSWRNYIPDAREDSLDWLDSNKIPYEKLVLTNNKHKVAVKENFCFFLDDNIMQCNRMAKSMVPTYLFERPWNRGVIVDSLVKTVRSWKDIENILLY